MNRHTLVLILMGSDSDLPVMGEAKKVLAELGVEARIHIASAHRSPEKVRTLVAQAEEEGVKVFIAGAGHAAHLAGFIAAHTTLPVIGVPLDSSNLNGLDALLATVQMPPGVPVATVAVGTTGAKNAGILAAQILALSDSDLRTRLCVYKKKLADDVDAKDQELAREQ